MKKSTLLPLALCLSTPVSADVLISQYVEGSSYNKALELYNSTSEPLSLDGYTLSVYSNGQTDASAIITLEGTVEANATWVIADNRSDPALSQLAQQLTSQNLFNGDDAVVLTKDGVVVDSLGQVGFRPDPQWGTSPVSTKDNTLVRKPTVLTGDTNPFDVFVPAQEYTGLPQDDFTGLGEHTLSDNADTGDSDGIPEGVCTNCPALDKVADAASFDASVYYAAVQSQIDAGYDVATIRATLSDVIATDQRQLTYSQVWSALTATDQDPANPDNIILFYSNRSLAKASNGSGAASTNPDNWNREHSWPKSHGFSSSATEAYTDIQHLRPTDISVNASRGNLDFDFSDSPLAEAPDNRIDGDSFEPRDDIKGDVARMMMYMDVRYEGMGNDITPDLSLVNRITDSGSPELGKLCTLVEWHNADPVDTREQTRQQAIYEYQGNRNPFVDNPDWVSMFYDTDSCDDTTPTEPEDPVEPELPTAAPLVLSAVFDGPLSGGVPKGIELYVAQDIADLSVCGVGSANNGNGSSGEEFVFPSVSANAGDYLYIASESTGFTNFFGFAPDYTSGAMSINGDDAIEVFCNGDRIDLYGETDVDGSGQVWEYADSFAYRTAGVPDGEFSADDWMIPGKDTLDGQADNATAVTPIPVGTYSLSPAQPFFSEYVEGGSYNKALEIVNLGSATLSLSDYAVQIFANGSENGNSPITLSGDLAPGDVFVLANNQSDAPVTSVADMLTSQVSFNGDDAVVLLHNGEIIDAIGQIGVRTEWGSGDTSTKDNTLRRKSSVSAGDANAFDAFDPAEQWDGFAKNTFDGLGQYGNGDNGGDPEQPSACYTPATLIHDVQGDSFASPLAGQTVEVEAVITHITPDLSGFFIQEEDQDADNNPATSEGVFVYSPGDNSALTAGDVVRFTASVSERYGRTQLSVQSIPQVCGTDSVSAVSLSLPVNDDADLEAVEGMLVTNQSDWVINNVYSYSQYGEVTVSSKRLYIPTQLFAPDSDQASALAAANARDMLIIDDNADGSGNSQYLLGAGGIDPYNPIRLGDKVSQVVGVMDYGFSNYRVRPLGLVDVIKENARTDEPALIEGNLTLASFNVLNLFNGNGQGEGFPTSRGADTEAEYERQLEKIVSAMTELDADAIGLMEIENDGFGPLSMIAQLTDALNQQMGEDVYAFVDAGVDTIGTDDITTGLLYRKDRVAPVGSAKILTPQHSISDENGPLFSDRNRPALTQRFAHKDTNREFVISVNHLKSKGSSCGAGDDDPLAGNCDVTRTRAAIALNTWLEAQYADVSKVIMGDMNAYAQENPITYLTSSGYINTLEQVNGKQVYTYTFRGESGTLDYQLVSGPMKDALTDATAWHINADEMPAVDYNSEYKPDAWLNTLLYRASDHDPVVTSFNLTLLGDMDGDNDVDTSDFRLFIKAVLFKQSVDPELDLNNDGRVNNKDIRFFRDLCTRKGCKREDRGRGPAKVSNLRSLFN
ncbi:ExeM/NucH family extracellular endonuclease [Salinimonas sp. HHU 13199]|uniref:ExeM/NucH family extracellular endonuclease n=1 Tax=Salinimonas profundi TaxID=2729140 RepID=A0ABR8LPC3_9ALTE|nr:ExeM/NucH family extracellular endonuclease [Salinimonas profundi]MBD3585965.1 ExeM/NucH family extracellular endonuclease [Salinimonas profundi]